MTLLEAIRIISKCLNINTGLRNNASLASYLKAVDKLGINRKLVDGYFSKEYPLHDIDDLLNDLKDREEEINLLRSVLTEKESEYSVRLNELKEELWNS